MAHNEPMVNKGGKASSDQQRDEPNKHGQGVDPEQLFWRQEKIGQGGFGEVWRAVERRTQKTVAIKVIDLEQVLEEMEDIRQEIMVLSQCDSPYVTKYFGSYLQGPKLWIVMEYLGGGSALDLLKATKFEEAHIAIVLRDVLKGLDYLHSERKVHRDIKAANILLSEAGEVKLADFGVAGQLTHTTSKRNSLVGTPFWMAPEVICRSAYDSKADIWSLGITAMELSAGKAPRSDLHPMKVLLLIPKSNPPQLNGPSHSKHFREVVEACLNKDPANRPTARELLKFAFIRKAKKNALIMDLIEKYKSWKERESFSDSSSEPESEESPIAEVWQTWRWDLGTLQSHPPPERTPEEGPPEVPLKEPSEEPSPVVIHSNMQWNKGGSVMRPNSMPLCPQMIPWHAGSPDPGELEQQHWIILSNSDFHSPPPPTSASYNFIAKLIKQLQGQRRGGSGPIAELERAFSSAERSCPGLCDLFVQELFRKVAPSRSSTQTPLLERLRMYVCRCVRPPATGGFRPLL